MKKWMSILLLAAMLLMALAACGNAAPSSDVALQAWKRSRTRSRPRRKLRLRKRPPRRRRPPRRKRPPLRKRPLPRKRAPRRRTVEAEEMIGSKDGNSYSNKTIGIRAEFPDTWSVLDDEQTAQVVGAVADNFSETDLADQLRQSGSLYDLYAMALDQSGDNVNVVIEDLGVVYGLVIDEARYLELAEKQLGSTLEQMGITDVKLDKQNYSFAGQERLSVFITGNYSGVPIYERMVLIKAGSYMNVITAFSLDAARLDGIMGLFEAYEG